MPRNAPDRSATGIRGRPVQQILGRTGTMRNGVPGLGHSGWHLLPGAQEVEVDLTPPWHALCKGVSPFLDEQR
jgi:hypothetical protein